MNGSSTLSRMEILYVYMLIVDFLSFLRVAFS